MSQRDRKTADGQTAPRASVAVLPTGGGISRSSSAEANSSRAVQWDELFLHATPAQRSELLALAQRQGLIYAHQLPALANGKKPAPLLEDQGRLNLLANLQSHPPERWQSVVPEAVTPCDEALDCWQRQAVARALGTTDVCLIAGLPGTGKSRVIAEIVSQAASRSLRVLFLAPHAQAIDAVLERVANRDVLFAVRCLEPGEKPEALAPSIRGLTHGERARLLREAVASACRSREQAEACCQRRRSEEALWPELRNLALQIENSQRQLVELQQRQQSLTTEVGGDIALYQQTEAPTADSSFAGLVREEIVEHQDALDRIEKSRKASEEARANQAQVLNNLEAERSWLLPLVQARQQGRWWSLAWWRALFAGDFKVRLPDLESRIESAKAEVEASTQQVQSLQRERQAQDERHQRFLDQILGEEVGRRHSDLQGHVQALQEQKRLLEASWQTLIGPLDPAELRPAVPTSLAVDEARQRWQNQVKNDEDHCQFSRHWSDHLRDSADSLTARLPALANLVAGTFSALASDKHFGQSSGLVFDLLIVDEAHELGEADFFRLARRARRWVLVGEPAHCGSSPAGRTASTPLGFFHRLWQHFHCDPGKLNYAWAAEGERFCCQLRPLSAEQRQRLESERLADFPDIELRILSLPHSPPALAEVVFPSSLSLLQAKQFIFQQLEELAVATTARNGLLVEENERWVFHFPDHEARVTLEVQLDAGLREVMASSEPVANGVQSWRTARLDFDKEAGWDRDRVERWLDDHLHLRDLGRTMLLEASHRMRPPLALLLSDLLFGGRHTSLEAPGSVAPAHGANGHSCPMIFMPVAMRRKEKPHLSPKQPASLDTTGLEIELGIGRAHERVPADLRRLVPARGLVNCSEAQALVRTLEELLADPAHLSVVCQPHRPAIAVIALFPAQVELIRQLVQRSGRIQQSSIAVEVGLPMAFGHREFPIVVVSLTRSNARAVAFAEHIAHLTQALTRARSQVILFGDPGTLTRRSQWQGRLDHLDEAAARQEEIFIKDLVRYLQGKGKHAWAFHLCEGHP